MKVLIINVVCGIRSTGRICTDLAEALEKAGHEVRIAYGREDVPSRYEKYAIRIGSDTDVRNHGVKARLSDACGFGSRKATEKFIDWVKTYNPDVIHLHNLHGYYINIEVLFDYLRTCKKRIVWTLHDCWAFTGHAAYCDYANCSKWKTGCSQCPNRKEYPASFRDCSNRNWVKKKVILTGIPNLTIITPSEWLASLVRESFLSQYPVAVIPNGVDTSVFKPLAGNAKERLGIGEKKIVLGVAALWEKRKGMDDFLRLVTMLNKDFRIVLVGLSAKQKELLPEDIVGIERTDSAGELAEIYAAADYYVNPTYEDNYPTTNLEAIACGTPVITYDTGGSAESALLYGTKVKKGDIEAIAALINGDGPELKADPASCREAVDYKTMVKRYLDLYKQAES